MRSSASPAKGNFHARIVPCACRGFCESLNDATTLFSIFPIHSAYGLKLPVSGKCNFLIQG